MNSENKTNKGEKGGVTQNIPPVSPRVVTYKKAAALKKVEAPNVTVGKVKKPGVAEPERRTPSAAPQPPRQTGTAPSAVTGRTASPVAPRAQKKPVVKHKKKRISNQRLEIHIKLEVSH